jgi:hypothetical protein
MNARIDDLIADTSYTVAWEADGIYLFRRGGTSPTAFAIDTVAGGSVRLDRVEVAVADEEGIFRPSARQPLELAGGQEVRVSLYWEALYAPDAEQTVSVRLLDGGRSPRGPRDTTCCPTCLTRGRITCRP